MDTRDEVFDFRNAINNLLLLKLAYDAGVDMGVFKDKEFGFNDYGFDQAENLFYKAVDQLFEIFEVYQPDYSLKMDHAMKKERNYWLALAGYEEGYDTQGIIVFLDDRITPFGTRTIGGHYRDDVWFSAFGEASWIENGIVFVFDEDEGALDYSDTLALLIQIIEDSLVKKESVKFEMAS
ncbi:hypothetical protein [Cytobacillus gottheilii]|uniref:hypothetical protein n=1 Tax=Cytobacillus gottheilii TaxID=859144 RepID=UPI00249587A2|nr:hypothetical protein [Cytobacillus gottheilii]